MIGIGSGWKRQLALLALCGGLGTSSSSAEEPVRLLFIGNSFTYYNNMPAMLEEISALDSQSPPVRAEMHARGGMELAEALDDSELIRRLESGSWDYVVLQEQSRLGSSNFINGRNVVSDPEPFFESVRAWSGHVRRVGAEPLLLATWLQADPQSDPDRRMVTWAYREIGEELGIPVIGADLAWRLAAEDSTTIELYDEDGLHPSPVGSLLVAALIHDRLHSGRQFALPAEVRAAPVEESDGEVLGDRIAVLGQFSEAERDWIRDTIRRVRGDTRSHDRPRPLTADALGDRSSWKKDAEASDFVGRWRGEAKHYPDFLPWPGEMTLEVRRGASGGLAGDLTITFEGVNFRVERSLETLRVSSGRLHFEDPEGPEDGVVHYEGGLTPAGDLHGVAELRTDSPGLGMAGEWTLTRE